MIGSEISPQTIVYDRRVMMTSDASYSTDLTLTTQEGDRVKLSFDNQQSQSHAESQTEFSEGVIVQEISSVAVAASQYSLTVEGDLSEEELEAIQKLVSETGPIAQRFFAQNEFDAEDVFNKLGSSLGAIEEIELSLEKVVTETFSFQSTRSVPAAVESQRQAELLPPAEDERIDPATIRDIPALVSAVVESEFSNQAAKYSNSNSILRSLGDLIAFLRDGQGLARFNFYNS